MSTTDKQKDHFAQYKNPEVIEGSGSLGINRVVAQLPKSGKWVIFESSSQWGGRLVKGYRLRDLSGKLVSFVTKEEAIEFSKKTR